MPLYDFQCADCGQAFEDFAPASPDATTAPTACPECSSQAVERQLVARVAVRTSARHTGRVLDLSSGACPCSAHGHARH